MQQNRVLVVQYLIAFSDAIKIVRKFKQKKHRDQGYSFELVDTNTTYFHRVSLRRELPTLFDADGVCKCLYKVYNTGEPMYHLTVYRTIA